MAIRLTLLFAVDFWSKNGQQLFILQELEEIKSDNFCRRKVGRAITLQEAKRKVQYCYQNIGKKSQFESA